MKKLEVHAPHQAAAVIRNAQQTGTRRHCQSRKQRLTAILSVGCDRQCPSGIVQFDGFRGDGGLSDLPLFRPLPVQAADRQDQRSNRRRSRDDVGEGHVFGHGLDHSLVAPPLSSPATVSLSSFSFDSRRATAQSEATAGRVPPPCRARRCAAFTGGPDAS